MDSSDHVREVVHAHIQARSFSEHAVVEVSFVLLCVIRCISDRLPVLLLCVASPHPVNWHFACKEVV